MRQNITLALLLLALLAGSYYFRAPIRIALKQIYARSQPCSSPLTYRIVSIDPKFGLSKAQAQSVIDSSASIWEKGSKRDLFAYDKDHGTIEISFVYDYRQEAIDRLKPLGISIDTTQSSYDQLRTRYETMKAKYDLEKRAIDARVAQFNADQSAYNSQVQKWNAQGGAPRDVYRQLEAQKAALVVEKNAIEQEQAAFNASVDIINALVVQLNRLASELNIQASTYNAIGRSTGGEFEEGVYESSFGHEKITIYEFADRTELVRVMAHELGHALGLEHVDDKNAIMYYLNEGSNERMSPSDLSALEKICGAL